MQAGSRTVDPVTQEELEVPHYASVDEVIHRAARRRDGSLPMITMRPDWTSSAVLWISRNGDHDAVNVDSVAITELLWQELSRWGEFWQAHYDSSGHWSDDSSRDDWTRAGSELLAQVQQQLWPNVEVVGMFATE